MIDYCDMSAKERDDFENDAASAWLDRKRDRELEERMEANLSRLHRMGYSEEDLERSNPYNQWMNEQ